MPRFSYYMDMSRRIRPLPAAPKVWNYIKYRCLARRAVTSVRRYAPQIGSLLLTMRCNLNCGYCNGARIRQENRMGWCENEADIEKVRRIFAAPLFANCLLVELMGGEPLLVNDLDRIVAYLAERGHIINTSTNGLLLAERVADLKRAGISRINVSLYDENRPVIERDLVGINRIFPVHASIVLLRSAVERMPDRIIETARFVSKAGCRSLRFFIYRAIGIDPQLEEIITDNNPAYFEFRRRVEDVMPGFCVWPAAVETKAAKKRCPQLWQRINCDMSEKITICCGTDTTLDGPGSNLFDGEPDMVFNHPALVSMREQLLDSGCEPPGICKACNLLADPGW